MTETSEWHLIHRDLEGEAEPLATELELASTWLRQGLGLMFRRRIDGDKAMVFEWDEIDTRDFGMLFVPFDLDILWLCDGQVVKKERLSAWTGRAEGRADCVVELAPGAAERVRVGHEVSLVQS
jgi:hypothetical protein